MEHTAPEGEWSFTGREQLEAVLAASDLEPGDICLVGSVSLSARGLREHNDVDFCVHPSKRGRVDEASLPEFIGVTEDRYELIDISDEELVENERFHDVIDGFKVVRPELTFSYKKLRDLPKDQEDIERLEQYSQATDDWDWELYRSDYSEPPDTLLSRGIQSLRTDGFLVTLDKVLGLVHRKFPVVRALSSRAPVHDLGMPVDALRNRQRTVSRAALLTGQYAGDEFVSLDLVAYWAAIDSLQRGEEPAFDLQKLGIEGDALLAFEGESSGPIRVSMKNRVIDARHTACALHDGPGDLTVEPTFERRAKRGEDWLRAQGFDAQEIAVIREKQGELFESVGGLFYAILWPPANEYFDDMERSLGNRVRIHESVDINVENVPALVKDIYDAQAHPVPEWSIDWKAQKMTDFPNTIRVLKIILPNPRIHDGVSREMEMVKNDVRHEFVDHFPDEYYLSLIHATDNFEDNLAAREVIEAHR